MIAHPTKFNASLSDYIPHQNMLVITYQMPNLNYAHTDIIAIADELLSLYSFIYLFTYIFIEKIIPFHLKSFVYT